MNKKGFTLIELLAVITVLAIILVIAIPNVLRLIKESKLKSLESSAKIIARKAEDDYTHKKMKNRTYNPTSIPCTDIVNKTNDYETCTIIYNSEGTATVSLIGAENKKFDNMFCSGTIDTMHCDELGKNSYYAVYSPNTSNLPSGYTELEYIESTGTQYIDTGVLGDNSNLSFDVKYKTPSHNVVGYVFGSYVGDNKSITRLLIYSNAITYYEINHLPNTYNSNYVSHSRNTIYTESVSRSENTITYTSNGTQYQYNINSNGTTQSSNILIFSRNGLNYTYKMKLYYFKIYDNGVLIRNFIPSVRNSDGVAGLYDIIGGQFYSDASGSSDNFEKPKQQFTHDLLQTLNPNPYTKEGYTFKEWNTKVDGTGTSYTDQQAVLNLAESGEVYLYAQWQQNS